jgi:hypothetical protein
MPAAADAEAYGMRGASYSAGGANGVPAEFFSSNSGVWALPSDEEDYTDEDEPVEEITPEAAAKEQRRVDRAAELAMLKGFRSYLPKGPRSAYESAAGADFEQRITALEHEIHGEKSLWEQHKMLKWRLEKAQGKLEKCVEDCNVARAASALASKNYFECDALVAAQGDIVDDLDTSLALVATKLEEQAAATAPSAHMEIDGVPGAFDLAAFAKLSVAAKHETARQLLRMAADEGGSQPVRDASPLRVDIGTPVKRRRSAVRNRSPDPTGDGTLVVGDSPGFGVAMSAFTTACNGSLSDCPTPSPGVAGYGKAAGQVSVAASPYDGGKPAATVPPTPPGASAAFLAGLTTFAIEDVTVHSQPAAMVPQTPPGTSAAFLARLTSFAFEVETVDFREGAACQAEQRLALATA